MPEIVGDSLPLLTLKTVSLHNGSSNSKIEYGIFEDPIKTFAQGSEFSP